MRTLFFPINDGDEIANRYLLVMSEYKVMMPESTPLRMFLYFSDKAHAVREERLKAAREGLVYHN